MPEIRTFEGEKSGRYLVTLKDNVDKAAFIAEHHIEPAYDYDIIKAFAGRFDDATLNFLRASDDVKSISEDPAMRMRPHAGVVVEYNTR